MDANLLHQGAAIAMEVAAAANGFVEAQAPWALAKDPERSTDLDATLASLARAILVTATLLEPFIPGKVASLCDRFGFDAVPQIGELATLDVAGRLASRGDILFPKEKPEGSA
jgi:methionyl-tRNA synthetase